jgi:ATP-binding cassette, subfamily B, bacterial MsbA
MIVFAICNLLSVIFSLISLTMLVPFLNLIFGKEELLTTNPGFALTKEGISNYFKYWLSTMITDYGSNKVSLVVLICSIIMLSFILKNLFLFIARYTLHPLRNGIVNKLRTRFFDQMLQLPIGYFSNKRKGDIMARLTNDVREIEESIISTMDLLFSTPIVIIVYLVFLFSLSIKLSIFLIVLLPTAGLIIGRISKNLRNQSTDNSQRIGNLLSIFDETISGLRIIKAFGAEQLMRVKFAFENNYLNKLNNKIAFRRELASPLSETMGIGVLCIILWYGSRLVFVTKELSGAEILLFVAVFTQLLDPLKKFSQIFFNIQKGSASIERVNAILLSNEVVQDVPNAKNITAFNHSIEFKNVDFYYDDTAILQNINILIPKGKTIALVGASGSGKSTLVDLIPRFHDCRNGEILIDGINIKEYKISDVRKLMGIVSQEPILFNDSIANNIALSNPEASASQIQQAAQVANAHTFINDKEEKYSTNIGDRGTKLSGGEKQRITIARAVLKNPPILILDEATSSLDTESERIVQDALFSLMENRTSIIIAHRLSTIKHANEIIVMDKGQIKERGSHTELLAKQGIYYNLINHQM